MLLLTRLPGGLPAALLLPSRTSNAVSPTRFRAGFCEGSMWLQGPISVTPSDRFQVGVLPSSLPSMLPAILLHENSLPIHAFHASILSSSLRSHPASFLRSSGFRSAFWSRASSAVLPSAFLKKFQKKMSTKNGATAPIFALERMKKREGYRPPPDWTGRN